MRTRSRQAILDRLAHRLFEGTVSAEEVVPRLLEAAPPAYAVEQPLASLIDHTALKPETTEEQIRQLCAEARTYGFASVCVNPCYVPAAAEALQGTRVGVCSVIGFPLGATTTAVKAYEAQQVVEAGAAEVDMVCNIGRLKSQRFDAVVGDVRAVVEAARTAAAGALVKVIIETCLLTDEEKVIACTLAEDGGADLVKTSTGFSTGGATAADVALMRRVVDGRLGVKASGGVRSFEDAQTMIRHGATRIGASGSVAIIQGISQTNEY